MEREGRRASRSEGFNHELCAVRPRCRPPVPMGSEGLNFQRRRFNRRGLTFCRTGSDYTRTRPQGLTAAFNGRRLMSPRGVAAIGAPSCLPSNQSAGVLGLRG